MNQQPLTNVQLELLRAFSHQLDEEELLELRRTLALFFAKRATVAADKVWEEKGWGEKDVQRLLKKSVKHNQKK